MKQTQITKYIVNFWNHGFTLQLGKLFYIQVGWSFLESTKLKSKPTIQRGRQGGKE